MNAITVFVINENVCPSRALCKVIAEMHIEGDLMVQWAETIRDLMLAGF
jgi:hypothetical protein